jgi:hypothetical protein
MLSMTRILGSPVERLVPEAGGRILARPARIGNPMPARLLDVG